MTGQTPTPSPESDPLEAALAWLLPQHRAAPADALARIRFLCEHSSDLFGAMVVVAATHPALPREILAAAIKQFRRDADALSQEDVAGLLNALRTGARQAFDTVLRTRRNADRKAVAMPWVKD